MISGNDRTLCPGTGCPIKARCVRFRAIGYGRYESFGSPPYDAAYGACHAFDDLDALRPTEAAIRERAYFIWIEAGRPEGQAAQHWAQACEELNRAFEADLRPV